MEQENKLREEVEFWLIYISDWKKIHTEPVPERALSLLENALLKLKEFNSEKNQTEPLQDTDRSIH